MSILSPRMFLPAIEYIQTKLTIRGFENVNNCNTVYFIGDHTQNGDERESNFHHIL